MNKLTAECEAAIQDRLAGVLPGHECDACREEGAQLASLFNEKPWSELASQAALERVQKGVERRVREPRRLRPLVLAPAFAAAALAAVVLRPKVEVAAPPAETASVDVDVELAESIELLEELDPEDWDMLETMESGS